MLNLVVEDGQIEAMLRFIGLIAKLSGNLLVGCHHFGRRENLLAVTSVMGGDLGGFGAAESATRDGLDDLLTARTGSVKIVLRESLDLRGAASSWLDLVAVTTQAEGQFRLIDGGSELLAVEESLRL